jgi:3-dehydroquinate synthase
MNNFDCRLQNKVTRITFAKRDEIVMFLRHHSCVAVFDTHTAQLLPPSPQGSSADSRLVVSAGEEHKTWQNILEIITAGMHNRLGRDGLFLGIGGGVVCDMTGFAAAVYMRGCRLVLVPTSLLAMVDAAIGGKTGIDFGGYKNIIGSFYPAEEVKICLDFLETLPDREFLCGLAEILKHALLADRHLLELLEFKSAEVLSRERPLLEEIVERAIRVKVTIVEKDFLENGVRELLNFGHTFGHALESVTSFSGWSHGEAVAWGMVKALETGVACGITEQEYLDRVRSIVRTYGYRTKSGVSAEKLIAAMSYDKKKRSGAVRFVLQRSLGDTFTTTVDLSLVKEVLAAEKRS